MRMDGALARVVVVLKNDIRLPMRVHARISTLRVCRLFVDVVYFTSRLILQAKTSAFIFFLKS